VQEARNAKRPGLVKVLALLGLVVLLGIIIAIGVYFGVAKKDESCAYIKARNWNFAITKSFPNFTQPNLLLKFFTNLSMDKVF